MRTININRDSWHYRLLHKLDFNPYWAEDFCHYLRKLLGACLMLLLVGMVGLAFVYATADMLVWLAWMVVNLQWVGPSSAAFIAAGLWALAAMGAAIIYLWILYERKVPDESKAVVSAAWEAVHSKVCFRVNMN